MKLDEEQYLAHYGILRKSGRYPWGSGGTQSKRNKMFLDVVADLKKDGLTEAEIAKGFDLTTTQLRALKTIALNEQKQSNIRMAQRLHEKGYSNVAIGERMGINESSVRSLLAPGQKDKADVLQATADMLRKQVDEKGYVDVGTGVELDLPVGGTKIGVSRTRFDTAVAVLREEGYKMHYVKVEQLGTGNQTTIKALGKPDSKYPKRDQIKSITDFSEDGGRTFQSPKPPLPISSKRVKVRYAEEGGSDADGVIYVRPGVKDISIGASRYAQVRIMVDGTHYMKGMAIYKDDLPPGVDLMFNTNKRNTGNKLDAMKSIKDDPENPFGAITRQILGPDGKPSSAMNIVGQKEGSGVEGGWGEWSRNLSRQMLSKQSPELAKQQLAMTYERRKNELDEIMSLTNPAVRKKLLESFADGTDAASVHLKAAALPGQATHVILPVNTMKPTEIYAPNYANGTRVALVRYPHGGTFEIPELTVNNRHAPAQKLLGKQSKDAVGIHHTVAERLSGADFDGDTVLVIPNNQGRVKSTPALEGLKGFDPQVYKIPEGSGTKKMTSSGTQKQMGDVTNLIADMTLKGASTAEIARAVRHSMVVIDAEKHGLDYRASAKDNGIAALKERYQGNKKGGASTLITRATSSERVPLRKPRSAAKGGPIDPATGKKVYEYTNESYVNSKGKTVLKTFESTKLAETDDARTLLSGDGVGTPMERIYADHSNRLKALANTARKELVNTPSVKRSPSAAKVHAAEVASLDAKLNIARKNAPLERQAQVIANAAVSLKRKANPDMSNAELKKLKAQELAKARVRTGAGKQRIQITQAEWNAIQAGAISNEKLNQILNNADLDKVKELATPRKQVLMTATKKARAQAMIDAGFTQAEIAAQLGVSLTTLKTNLS